MSTEQKDLEQNALASGLTRAWANFKQGKLISYKVMALLLIVAAALFLWWYIAAERKKAESVMCAADRKDALTRAKKGETIKSKDCGDAAVKADYELGDDLGVEGTPAIFTQNGDYIGGYLSPVDLVQAIQESQKTAAAAR